MSSARTHRPIADPKRCKLCDLCRLLCPDLAITIDSQEQRIHIDLKYCKGCGICAGFCPKGAIHMGLEPKNS
jgi:pyruvate ferredoxin oxidoreductase delta subunit